MIVHLLHTLTLSHIFSTISVLSAREENGEKGGKSGNRSHREVVRVEDAPIYLSLSGPYHHHSTSEDFTKHPAIYIFTLFSTQCFIMMHMMNVISLDNFVIQSLF